MESQLLSAINILKQNADGKALNEFKKAVETLTSFDCALSMAAEGAISSRRSSTAELHLDVALAIQAKYY